MTKLYCIFSEFSPQAHNLEIVYSLLRKVEGKELSNHEAPAVAVFMAFSIESYLNSIGDRRKFNKWRDRDSWREKIKLLHRESGRRTDWSSPHLKLALNIFQIRDRLAHGRSETAKSRQFSTLEDANTCLNDRTQARPKPNWLIDLEQELPSIRPRFDDLLSYLAEIGGVGRLDFLLKTLDYVATDHPKAS